MSNDIEVFKNYNLPAKPEDLQKFIILGIEKLNVICSHLKLINNLEMTIEFKKQKEEEMVRIAKLIILAEIKIKEFLKEKESEGKTKKEKASIYRSELKKLNITLHENAIITKLYNFQYSID